MLMHGMNKRRNIKQREKRIAHAVFVAPSVLLYTGVSVLPILLGIYYSLTDWNGITKKYHFIGLKNYVKALTDSRFQRALLFNLKYALILIVCIVTLSTIIALLLNQKIRGQSFFRSLYFFPSVISMLTAGLIFNEIYYRALPRLGENLGIELLQSNILASPNTAVFGILFVHIWQGAAIPTILLLSALKTIPTDIIEAAYIDGATRKQQFRYITVPFILPILSVVLVLVLKDGLMVYDYIMGLTQGGPAGATESITLLLYRQGFEEMKFSYSIAQSIIISIVIMTISFLQISFTNRKKVY